MCILADKNHSTILIPRNSRRIYRPKDAYDFPKVELGNERDVFLLKGGVAAKVLLLCQVVAELKI
jgi:hypothetical protein